MHTTADNRITQRGLWFEEFEIGAVYAHSPGRTLGEADNTLFTTLTMNSQPLHLDEHWSSAQEFEGRLVNSLLTMSTVVGLSVSQLTLNTIVANLGFEEVTFPHPVRAGDTIYAETHIVDKRLSRSRPTQGVVQMRHVGLNQNGIVVATIGRSTLVHCAPLLERSES